MYEFDIYNKITGERDFVIGHFFEETLVEYGLNPKEWALCGSPHYID